MGTLHKEMWVSSGAGTSRRQRASGVYYWYMPTLLADLSTPLDEDVVADVARAERALAQVEGSSGRGTEGIARLLLRSESVASSRIEGLVIGSRRILQAELWEEEPGNVRYDRHAAAVLGNIHAMERARMLAASASALSVDMLCEIHRELCRGTDVDAWGGVVRTVQNWVGGSASNPLAAEYVPPAPEAVPGLLDDLVAYANRTDVSPIVQAALCHAQFETIHPFVDGNGRTGRALIQVCLIRSGAVRAAIPPISLALATMKRDYYAALQEFQHSVDRNAERKALNDWVSCFSGAVVMACDDMVLIARDMGEMQERWRGLIGSIRAGSTLELLLAEIQAMPIFSVESLVRATGRSKQAVGTAVARLVAAGIARQTTRGKRNRVFETPEVLEAFNVVERRLASPARDTAVEPPARPVPARKT